MAAKEDAELEELIRNAGGGEPEEEEDGGGLDLTTLLMVARRSLPWMLLLIMIGVTASWLFLRYTPSLYKASSTLKIDEKSEAGVLLGDFGQAAEQKQTLNKLSGEIELIKSDIIYRRLKDSLDLDVNYYVQGTVLQSELYDLSPVRVEYTAGKGAMFNQKIGLQLFDRPYIPAQTPEVVAVASKSTDFDQPSLCWISCG